MRIYAIRLLIKLLERFICLDHTGADKEARTTWLLKQFQDQGLRSYFKVRDYQILKEIGGGLEQKDYWIHIGQRLELLYLVGKSKEEFDLAEKRAKRDKDKKIDEEAAV